MAQLNEVQRTWVVKFLGSTGSPGTRTAGPSQGGFSFVGGSTGVSAQNAPPGAPNPIDDLTKAIEADNLTEVQRLIGTGMTLDALDTNGMSPLTQAAKTGKPNSVQIADELLRGGANVDFRNHDQETPLIVAALAGDQPMAQFLLNHRANVDAQDLQARSPLYISVERQDLKLAEFLLKQGADVDRFADFDRTPLMEAASKGNLDIVKLLVKNKADVNRTARNGSTALMEASLTDPKIVDFLLQNYADPNMVDGTYGETALMSAARLGKQAVGVAVGKSLLKAKAEVNIQDPDGKTALMKAAENGNDGFIAELLKDSRVDANLKDKDSATALILAAKFGNTKTVENVLKFKNVKVDEVAKNGNTALMEAAARSHPPGMVKAMLSGKQKPKLDLQDASGNTALILAVESADVDGVQALLAAKANKDIKNSANQTALDVAMDKVQNTGPPNKQHFEKIVQLLQPAQQQTQPAPSPKQTPQPTSP